MHIKLISPKMSLRPMDSEFKRRLSPSISLATVAAITPGEHEVYIEDENVEKIDLVDDPDLVGININVDTAYQAYEIAKKYRKRGIPTIAGGIFASTNPQDVLEHFDSVVVGEAENSWPQALRDLETGKLQKLYYSKEPVDLKNSPAPDWSKLNTSSYLYTNVLAATRGCPFRCEFCYNSSDYVHNRFRTKSIENVLKEIEALGTRHVMFIDDNLIGDPKWALQLAQALKPMGLKWNAAVSANIVHMPKLLDAFAESGCQSLFIGFESINEDSLKQSSKHQNDVSLYEKLAHAIHQREIMINASLVFGIDSDKPDVFSRTLDWLLKNKIETMTAHIATPYPGTKYYQRLKTEGRITDHDLSHYNTSNVVFEPKYMTAKELREGYLWIYKEFYSLKNILKKIPKSKKQRMPYLLFALGYRKFGPFFSQVSKFGLMRAFGKLGRRMAYGLE